MLRFFPDLLFLTLILALSALVWPGGVNDAPVQAKPDKPNIIVVNLDDADSEIFELGYSDVLFPNIMGIAKRGITFDNLHVTTPLCGPSRACFYRAQYAHHTEIRVNDPVNPVSHNLEGGFDFYKKQGYLANDLSTWMHDAGYRTMMVGKFLHEGLTGLSVPQGWDDFYYSLGGRYYGTYRFTNQTHPNGTHSRLGEDEYRTNVEADDCERLLQVHADRNDGKPFFLNVNPYGPHNAVPAAPEMIDREKLGWWLEARVPFSPALNESDTRDKRGHFAKLPLLSNDSLGHIDKNYRLRLLATRSVDEMVGRILDKIRQLGIEDSTYVFITSDNGFLLGHHRAFAKGLPVDRASRVPLFVQGPKVPAQAYGHHLLGHIDIGPTVVELAGGTVPDFVDGRSFAKLLRPGGLDLHPQFRQNLLIENWISLRQFSAIAHAASSSVRTPDTIYTEWGNGDRDFFNLATDPKQLSNSYDELQLEEQLFHAELLRTLKDPAQKAMATFVGRHEPGATLATEKPIEGLAEAARGVNAVKLSIYDPPANQYWNGQRWQKGFTPLTAQLRNPNGQVTIWEYDSLPKRTRQRGSQISVRAWAYDDDFRTTGPVDTRYVLDLSGPETTIVAPQQNEQLQSPVTLRGKVFDDSKIKEVRLFLRRCSTNHYYHDGQFSPTLRPVILSPNTSGTWLFEADLSPGRYTINVRAYDIAGNVNEEPLWRYFEVTNP